MIFIEWPLMLCALVPVIVLEALLVRLWVPLSYREAFLGVGRANLYSTLVGIPMAWGIMFIIQIASLILLMPVGFAAVHWHWNLNSPPFRAVAFLASLAWEPSAKRQLFWVIPTAAALLLLPCFYVSIILERRSCLKSWTNSDPALVRRGVYFANLASYGLLFLMACGWIIYQLQHTAIAALSFSDSCVAQIGETKEELAHHYGTRSPHKEPRGPSNYDKVLDDIYYTFHCNGLYIAVYFKDGKAVLLDYRKEDKSEMSDEELSSILRVAVEKPDWVLISGDSRNLRWRTGDSAVFAYYFRQSGRHEPLDSVWIQTASVDAVYSEIRGKKP